MNNECMITKSIVSNRDVTIQGFFTTKIDDDRFDYVASNPADYRSSFSGSGLPYASVSQAFDSTPNKGTVKVGSDNSFKFQIAMPNKYYDIDKLVKPNVTLIYKIYGKMNKIDITLEDPFPFRTLKPTEDYSPLFYQNEGLKIRTQEQILRESELNSDHEKFINFWGLKPPA